MKLAETLLPRLNEWRPTGPAPYRWIEHLPVDAGTLTFTVEKTESLGCLCREVVLERGTPITDLKGLAEQLADRLGGLTEPLRVYEIDTTAGVALLRSKAPLQRQGQLLYFELRLEGKGIARLRRFQASQAPGTTREAIAFALTHEVMANLAQDLARA